MAENIQGLIKKIQEEGIKAAEEKAKQIEEETRRQAEAIIEKARCEAEKLMREAEEKNARREEYTKTLLKQAARDCLLSLRKEINQMLDKIILLNVREVFGPDELTRIIALLIKEYGGATKADILILLKKEDCERLEKYFLDKLKEETKKRIILKPSEDIIGGFAISYDGGKSQFDFTDKALAEYIGRYLKPRLKDLFNEAVSEK